LKSKESQESVPDEIQHAEISWINQALDLVGIKSNAVLPVMGGLLVHVKGEGIIWIPRARVAGLLSKSGFLDTLVRQGGISASVILAPILNIIFAPISVAYSQFVKRGFRLPPNRVTSYSKCIIDRVLLTRPTLYHKLAYALGGAKEKVVSALKREHQEQEDEKVTNYALRVIDKLEELAVEEELDSDFIAKMPPEIKSSLERLSLPENFESEPSLLESEFTSTNSEQDERTGKMKKIAIVKDRAKEKLKGAKEKLEDKGAIAKEKLVGTKIFLSEKMSRANLQKIMKWLQEYPLFRIRLHANEMGKLQEFLQSLQKDGIEVDSALDLEDRLSLELE
jgi:hypothetical protein